MDIATVGCVHKLIQKWKVPSYTNQTYPTIKVKCVISGICMSALIAETRSPSWYKDFSQTNTLQGWPLNNIFHHVNLLKGIKKNHAAYTFPSHHGFPLGEKQGKTTWRNLGRTFGQIFVFWGSKWAPQPRFKWLVWDLTIIYEGKNMLELSTIWNCNLLFKHHFKICWKPACCGTCHVAKKGQNPAFCSHQYSLNTCVFLHPHLPTCQLLPPFENAPGAQWRRGDERPRTRRTNSLHLNST